MSWERKLSMTLQENVMTEPTKFKKKFPSPEKKSTEDLGEVVEILLTEAMVTPKQVRHALRVMSKLETNQSLVSVLQDLKFVTDEQIHRALQKHQVSMPLVDLLVELGYLQN
jgi:hypothetical protein